MKYPLHVAFLWHMHQPDYLDPETGHYALPWVRLHAAKDYLRMAELVRKHPGVHVTVNFVPTLLDQIEAYANGTVTDEALAISEKTSWTAHEKAAILSLFFSVNERRVLSRYPRYVELKGQRDASKSDPAAFSRADYLDLIALFNLSWMDAEFLRQDKAFAEIAQKGSGYNAKDIRSILRKQQEMIGQVIPTWKALAEQGQVELTCSPYYHPILPLVANTDVAEIASPHLPVLSPPFAAPEDAQEQLKRAVEAHTSYFGQAPKGLWPSEGAIGPDVLPMIGQAGFQWFASDEAILARSLGVRIERDGTGAIQNPAMLYQPYFVEGGDGPVAGVFRDHELSDRIGFVYQGMDSQAAASDLVDRLKAAQQRLVGDGLPYVAAIILDGENAWEYYDQNGSPFLHALYEQLSQEPTLRMVTISEVIEQFPPRASIEQLFTGSWINGNLETWIGEPKHNLAWGWLRDARQMVSDWQQSHADAPAETLQQALQEIYRAEGSDWFWWYSSRNASNEEHLFDELYRASLRHAYHLLGQAVPDELAPGARPARALARAIPFLVPPSNEPFSESILPDSLTLMPTAASRGAAQRASGPVRHMHVYHDEERLYLRLETYEPLNGQHLSVDMWPGSRNGKPPKTIQTAAGSEPAAEEGVFIAQGVDWLGVSIRFDVLQEKPVKKLSVRAALTDPTGEPYWVPSERPAELVMESPEG